MPRPKAKGKKDVVPLEAAAKELIINGLVKEEQIDPFDALKSAANDVAEPTDIPVKSTNDRGGRGKKVDSKAVEKEEMPAKSAASKSRNKKKSAEDVEEVVAKEIENGNAVGLLVEEEEAKEEVVTKGKGGRGKRGTKDSVDNVEKKENGEAEKLKDVATKGRLVKKNAKSNKAVTEDPNEIVSEKSVDDKADDEEAEKLKDGATKGRFVKKNAKSNKAVTEDPNEVGSEKSVDDKAVDEEAEKLKDVATKGRLVKKNAKSNKAATEDPNEVVSEKSVDDKADDEEPEKLKDGATKGRFVKKNAKSNKAVTEDPNEVGSEKSADDPKAAETKPAAKAGGRKKKTEEKEAVVVVSTEASTEVSEKPATKTGGRKKKTDEKPTVDVPTEALVEVVPVVVEAVPAKIGGRKKKTDEKEVVKKEINDDSVDNQEQPPKRKGRGATKKAAVKEEDVESKSEESAEVEVESVKKPTKRGAKEATKDKTDAAEEKIPTKRARGAKISAKVEEAPVDDAVDQVPAEEIVPKKRSRKEPSVEKEIKPEAEKPKKNRGGGKRKADKIDEEAVVESNKQGKAEGQDENVVETEESKKVDKPTTSRGGKRAAPSANKLKAVDDKVDDDNKNDVDPDDDEADGSKPSKAKKKKDQSAAPMNAATTKYNKADFDLPPLADDQKTDDEPRFNFKISSWNVAGLRAWVKKEGLTFLEYEEPDIFCLQETKCTTDQLPEEVERIPGYHPYWLCMPGGYAGVAIYSKIMPINVEYGIGDKGFDDVGRLITAEYEKFFLINVYVPNSGRKLVNLDTRMKWEKLFQEFVQKLNDIKPVVICGDMNVSHQEIDLSNPKTNTRNAGFTKEEREKMTDLLALGYVDTFRHLYPDRKGAYTFWTFMGNARSRNVGWRLDYFIVSERFVKRVVDNCIRSQCMGSDHCPITLFLKL